MTTIRVFDPPLCCATGVCGSQVDPVLVKFADDVRWLEMQGVRVERYNLAQQPQAFSENPAVKAVISEQGVTCLPLIIVNDEIAYTGRYPRRKELARFAVAPFEETTAVPLRAIQTSRRCDWEE